MDAAPSSRTRLGALLLRKGLVTPVELEGALEAQRKKGGLLGEILIRSGLATRPAIENALAEQVGEPLEAEAGFGTGLRSQIATRRPRRAARPATQAVPAAPAAVAVAVAPAPRPVLEAVPPPPEPVDAVVRPLGREPRAVPDATDLAAELTQQVARWQRLADELRRERDAVQQQLSARDRSLAAAYAQLEEAAGRPAAEGEARAEAPLAELEELRRSLEAERAERTRADAALSELRTELEARTADLLRLREELELARSRPAPAPAAGHVLFLRAGRAYAVLSREGPPPAPGERVELDAEQVCTIVKVGRSPFAGDARPCAFAEPA